MKFLRRSMHGASKPSRGGRPQSAETPTNNGRQTLASKITGPVSRIETSSHQASPYTVTRQRELLKAERTSDQAALMWLVVNPWFVSETNTTVINTGVQAVAVVKKRKTAVSGHLIEGPLVRSEMAEKDLSREIQLHWDVNEAEKKLVSTIKHQRYQSVTASAVDSEFDLLQVPYESKFVTQGACPRTIVLDVDASLMSFCNDPNKVLKFANSCTITIREHSPECGCEKCLELKWKPNPFVATRNDPSEVFPTCAQITITSLNDTEPSVGTLDTFPEAADYEYDGMPISGADNDYLEGRTSSSTHGLMASSSSFGETTGQTSASKKKGVIKAAFSALSGRSRILPGGKKGGKRGQ